MRPWFESELTWKRSDLRVASEEETRSFWIANPNPGSSKVVKRVLDLRLDQDRVWSLER